MESLKISLGPGDMAEIRAIVDTANASDGDRYPEEMMQHLFNTADTPPLFTYVNP